jgi:hypothetical protein
VTAENLNARSRQVDRLVWIAILLGSWGILGGRIAAIGCSACCFYLAWHIKKSRVLTTHAVQARSTTWRSRLLLGSVVIGCVMGAVEAYLRFSGFGWSHALALGAALAVSGAVGILMWLVVRRALYRDMSAQEYERP